eukprot:7361455-Alexandrium_andersonii.AAC.1
MCIRDRRNAPHRAGAGWSRLITGLAEVGRGRPPPCGTDRGTIRAAVDRHCRGTGRPRRARTKCSIPA